MGVRAVFEILGVRAVFEITARADEKGLGSTVTREV